MKLAGEMVTGNAAMALASRSKRSLNCSAETLMAHITSQAGVAGSVDLAHPGCADRCKDLVWSQAGARSERHIYLTVLLLAKKRGRCASLGQSQITPLIRLFVERMADPPGVGQPIIKKHF